MTTYESRFDIGDRVRIDDHADMIARVTGVCWKTEDGHTIEASWIHAGANQSAWFPPWRLSVVGKEIER